MQTLGTLARVSGSPMTLTRDIVEGDLFLLIMTDDGVPVTRVRVDRLNRQGTALLAEWVNLARPPIGDVWDILAQLPAEERDGFLSRVDAEGLEENPLGADADPGAGHA